jgi:hypothetical protein
MAQIFGTFIGEFPPEHDSLELMFTPDSRPIKRRWRNNRLSAHFVADYLASFFPMDEDDAGSEKRIKQGKGAVSYIANELLENAMKFHDQASSYKVKFGIHFIEGSELVAVIFTTNSVQSEGGERFKLFIKELLESDPAELYLQQVEKSIESDTEASGLGLVTMINDYSAKIGWKFDTLLDNPDEIAVTTLVQISI